MNAIASENDGAVNETTKAKTPQWLAMVLAVFFALFFAYDVWEALGNFVGLLNFANGLDRSLNVVGWVVLVGALVLPIALFALAFWAGRLRGPLQQIALYVAALAVSAVLYLDIFTLFGAASLIAA